MPHQPTSNAASKPVPAQDEQWFDNLVATIRAHQMQLKTATANEELQEMYSILMNPNPLETHGSIRALSSKELTRHLVTDYAVLLDEQKVLPQQLYVALSLNGLKVWAVIADDDEETESKLIRIEAKLNAKYYPYGFRLDSMIFEATDNLPIPPHYQVLFERPAAE